MAPKFLLPMMIAAAAVSTMAHGESRVALAELDSALQKNQWNEAVELASELLDQNPNSAEAKLKGAYALFQSNHPNAALLLLSRIPPAEWKKLPQGPDRLAEVVALFQKKVPLNLLPSRLEQVSLDEASGHLKDEIRFAKGRQAFEKNQAQLARQLLEEVSEKSRLYGQARYLLGALAVKTGEPKTAAAEFSKVFGTSVYDQSTEIWEDMSAQITSHWGANLKVMLNAGLIADNTKVGELAILGIGRLAYAAKDHKAALTHYAKITKSSQFYPRATLERIWTLLALGQHEEAQKLASELSLDEGSFESLEARTARALILVDAGRTEEARHEIEQFLKVHETAKRMLTDYDVSQGLQSLPPFLRNDLQPDMRIQNLNAYQNDLKSEIKALRAEDQGLFPAYLKHAIGLEPLVAQAKDLAAQFTQAHVARRRSDLQRLLLQIKLITIETYLEDREKLRSEYRGLSEISEAKQAEHDERLAALLEKTVQGVDELLSGELSNDPRLEFRQSELLWELSTARSIIAQTKKDEKQQQAAMQLRERSLKIAQDIVKKYPNFYKRSQAMFFSGYALFSLDRIKESTQTLKQYAESYPKHSHVPDAYRILADARFDVNDFAGAESLYKKVLEFPESPVVGYALYKIGWCAYNLKDFAKALLGLEKAVMWATAKNKDHHLLSLQREARRDLITLYAEIGDHRKAQSYFSQFLQGEPTSWLADLGRELDRIGQYEKSGDIYRLLINSDPTSKDNISYQAAIIRGYHQLHRWPEVVDATKQLVSQHRGILGKPATEDAAILLAEQVVRDAVLAQHFEYSKRATPESASRVLALDTLYLSAFEAWPTSQSPMYRYAHLLLAQDKKHEASDIFEKHWAQFKASLQEPLREESLRNLIHSLDQEEVSIKENTATLSAPAKKLLEYSTEYQKDYRKEKYARAIDFLRPVILFKYSQPDQAIAESQKLFDANPADDIGKRCFQNLRQAYYQKKNWKETYGWASDLLTRKSPGLANYSVDLKAIREESLFLWAQGTTDDLKSAELFEKIAQDQEMRRLREKSLYNAYVRTQKAGQKLKAIELADTLERIAPQYEELASISGVRAAIFQEAGDYARARPLLEKFLKSPTKDTPPETLKQAKTNSQLIGDALENKIHRADQRQSNKEYPKWAGLAKMREEFERRPVPGGSDLVARIKKATATFEALTNAYLNTATNKDTPTFFAFESYCSVPLMYSRFSQAIMALADAKGLKPQEAEELRGELRKIATPLDAKAKEFSDQCLAKSVEIDHDGPNYRTVNQKWGWQADAANKEKAEQVLAALQRHAPWFDRLTIDEDEAALLKRHYNDKGSEESWYALAKSRWNQGKPELSRLTVIDALGKQPNSGKLLNIYAVIESRAVEHAGALYEKAGEKGSSAAWANLALYHLNGARLGPAIAALTRALDSDAFAGASDVKSLVKDFLRK